jgi:hypothetical protein
MHAVSLSDVEDESKDNIKMKGFDNSVDDLDAEELAYF